MHLFVPATVTRRCCEARPQPRRIDICQDFLTDVNTLERGHPGGQW